MRLSKPLEASHKWLEHQCESSFYKCGFWIANNRRNTLIFCTVLCLLCCLGFINIKYETDGIDLWVPSDSKGRIDYGKLVDTYGGFDEYAKMFFEAKDNGNIFNVGNMTQIWNIYDGAMALTGDKGQSYSDICVRDADGVCDISGILKFWSNNPEDYLVNTDQDLLVQVRREIYPNGDEVDRNREFGNAKYDEWGYLLEATAVYILLPIEGQASFDSWLDKYLSYMDSAVQNLNGMNAYYFSSDSVDREVSNAAAKEIYLFFLAFIFMLVFTMCTLGELDRVKGRARLAVLTTLWIAFSGVAAYGLCSGFGVPLTALQQVLPFLLIGVGLDDAFIITCAFDDTNPHLSTAERVGSAIGRCGLSVCFTSVINFVIFMVGSVSSLPAIRYFCIYSGMAILMDFFIQVPTFLAVLSYDNDRQNANESDLICLKPLPSSAGANLSDAPTGPQTNNITENKRCEPGESTITGRFFKKQFMPKLLSTNGSIFAIVVSLALFCVSIWGITMVKTGLDSLDLVPNGSYARDYIVATREYDSMNSQDSIPMYIVFDDLNVTDVGIQSDILELQDKIIESEYADGPTESWLTDFLFWATESQDYRLIMDENGFFPRTDLMMGAIAEFLADPYYAKYNVSMVFSGNETLVSSRVSLNHVNASNSAEEEKAMLEVRSIISNSVLGGHAYAFSVFYTATESNMVLFEQVLQNFLLAVIVVFVFSVIVIGHVRYALLVCLLIVVVDVEVMAFLYFWDHRLNTITAVQMIMVAGLITDLIVHIVHYFTATQTDFKKSIKERVLNAASEIGPSVMFAGLTTFLGVLMLAFAKNTIFQTFFSNLFSIIVLGMFAGLVTLPVLLLYMPERSKTVKVQDSLDCLENDGDSRGGNSVQSSIDRR